MLVSVDFGDKDGVHVNKKVCKQMLLGLVALFTKFTGAELCFPTRNWDCFISNLH